MAPPTPKTYISSDWQSVDFRRRNLIRCDVYIYIYTHRDTGSCALLGYGRGNMQQAYSVTYCPYVDIQRCHLMFRDCLCERRSDDESGYWGLYYE